MREPERWDKQDCSPRFFHACPETGNIRRHTCDGERQGNDPAMERLHIGNLIRAKLAERGRTVIWLARQMPCSRTNIYKILTGSPSTPPRSSGCPRSSATTFSPTCPTTCATTDDPGGNGSVAFWLICQGIGDIATVVNYHYSDTFAAQHLLNNLNL